MTENNASPDPQSESPQSPSRPEKHSSFSKGLENIILFGAGITFIISLLSKNKKAEKDSIQTEVPKEKNDIEPTQDTRKFHFIYSWAENLRISKKFLNQMRILTLVFLIFLLIAILWGYITEIISLVFIYLSTEGIPLGIALLATLITAFFMFLIKRTITTVQTNLIELTNKYFIATLAGLAILGASSALLIPSYTNLFREPGYTSPQQDGTRENPEKVQNTPTPTASPTGNKAAEVEQKSTSDLRLHLLYITGGIIAILGLIETNRKNSQDHIRQVHAARRDRYIQAIDKLSSKNASVRLGGIYALVGLADEWLDDDNIDEEPRVKEAQVIINNLCSYIRTPFELADKREVFLEDKEPDNYPGNYDKDRSKFYEEYHIRESIFKEIDNHLTVLVDGHDRDLSGPWCSFTFNFDNSPIFYDLIYLKYTNTSFNGAKFYARAIFENSHFFGLTDFTNAKFFGRTSFNDTFFIGGVSFRGAVFMGETSFQPTLFKDEVHFDYADFTITANFSSSLFCGPVNFQNTKFFHEPLFSGQSVISSENFPYSIEHAAKFSYKIPSQKHNFITSQESNFKIETKPISFRDIEYEIPIGSAIFDPGSFDKEKWEYIQVSEPAK